MNNPAHHFTFEPSDIMSIEDDIYTLKSDPTFYIQVCDYAAPTRFHISELGYEVEGDESSLYSTFHGAAITLNYAMRYAMELAHKKAEQKRANEFDVKVRRLARYFAALVRESFDPHTMATIIKTNMEKPDCCATGDHMDSNALMYGAYCALMFAEPDAGNETDANLMNGAWDIAKAAHFWVSADLMPKPKTTGWTGSPCPVDPDNYWIQDGTGTRIKAAEAKPY
jgi:hypothetical protein